MMDKKLSIGGQAVIEGVMIRSPNYNVVAVRKKNCVITKKEKIKQRKSKFFKLPIVRGFFNLVDMLVAGMRSLIWSSEQQMEKNEKISSLEIVFTLIFSIGIAIFLFLFVPYFFVSISGFSEDKQPLMFNLIDGFIRIIIFLAYILVISMMKDIKVLFQYHGAEHKAIHCYEKKKILSVGNIKKFSTLHPRCGTAFIMIVLLVSILAFSMLSALITYLFPNFASMHPIAKKAVLFAARVFLLPLIAGISYEFLKLDSKYEHNPLLKIFVVPGLLMQKITTKEPTKRQMEVAMAAVKEVLQLEKSNC